MISDQNEDTRIVSVFLLSKISKFFDTEIQENMIGK